MKGNLFMLGCRALGSPGRRWQLQYCVDMAEAERIAAGLGNSEGGGRWRVYGVTRVQLPDGPVRLDRGDLLAEGVVRLRMRQAGIHREGATAEHDPGGGGSGSAEVPVEAEGSRSAPRARRRGRRTPPGGAKAGR